MRTTLTLLIVTVLQGILCCRSALPAPLIVETPALTPEEQRLQFVLPPGFEIQLVASEPDIGQPMNLAFDPQGRLWATNSLEYPYPAQGPGVEERDPRFQGGGDHPPRDRLTVFAGIGPDGKPQSITNFVTGLNIPIGQVPVPEGAIVYSIPDVSLYRDTDGDGVADSRERLLGTFGNVDTHGMVNSFTRWLDGWIYACHGFRNTSHVSGSDGAEITMNSGNTFRFRMDGSHVEQFTWGQVNPFGLTFDPWGNLYSADCHSMPITCLLRGAYYSSFGKPDDGLGFGPNMTNDSHGSTGICGAAWYDADHFPAVYRDCIYICNPVNGQVHRDRIAWHGSSPAAVRQPDFITCRDGWFRPVDVQLGPDGALYVADFYNAVIGHYEVPLNDPHRDRTHGRIWRVVYRGEDGSAETPEIPDLTSLDAAALVDRLGDVNFTVRTLAANRLLDQFGAASVDALRDLCTSDTSSENQRAAALWLLFRSKALDPSLLDKLSGDASPVVRTHLARCLAEFSDWDDRQRAAAQRLIGDEHAMVRRAAADALGRHPQVDQLSLLLSAWGVAADDDTHLKHVIRIALRNQLSEDEIAEQALTMDVSAEHRTLLEATALGTRTAAACELLIRQLDENRTSGRQADVLQHLARFAALETLPVVVDLARDRAGRAPRAQLADLETLAVGIEQRGLKPRSWLDEWAGALVAQLLDSMRHSTYGWSYVSAGKNAFVPQRRPSADGDANALFFSSLPGGEQQTGVLRSEPFELPATLSFYIAGHNDRPDRPEQPNNVVRLRDAATNQVLREALPPRNDTAQRVEWDLSDVAGKQGYLEIVDGDNRGAYAWLAVGRFSIDDLNPRDLSPLPAATELIGRFHLNRFARRLVRIVSDQGLSFPNRIEAARGLLALAPDARLSALVSLAADPAQSTETRERTLHLVMSRNEQQIAKLLSDVMRQATQQEQRQIADSLLASQRGTDLLLKLMESGHASARLLLDPALRQRVEAGGGAGFSERVEALTTDLPPINEQLVEFMHQVRDGFSRESASAEQGHAVFTKNCAVCHQLGGEGKKIGPQLDGIGVRGVDRLLEDIIDPNRNVDAAFRSTVVLTREGQIVSGLVRRDEGGVLVLADNKGEEVRVPVDDIEEKKQTPLSLMPANLQQVLGEEQVRDLLAWLLQSVDKSNEEK